MNRLLACLACGLLLLLAGCAAPPGPPGFAVEALLRDDAFGPPQHPLAAADVLAVSDAMRRHADQELAPRVRRDGLQRALQESLYRPGALKLEYDARSTRTAAEAFDARAGNCLSLVLMSAAFAHHLGLDVGYQAVHVPQAWERLGDLVVTSGHVNLVLGPRPAAGWIGPDDRAGVVVDFLPPEQTRGQRSWRIGEPTVVAMLFNNRAAAAVAEGRLDDAYAHARAAVLQDPSYTPGLNTLAVVYQRRGLSSAAVAVLRGMLAREPDNLLALANLEPMLRRQGADAEADALAARRAALEPRPPFHWHDAGLAALGRGDLAGARDAFARELARADGQAQTHHAMAVTLAALGDADGARRHLESARRLGPTDADRRRYGAKLAALQTARGPAAPPVHVPEAVRPIRR